MEDLILHHKVIFFDGSIDFKSAAILSVFKEMGLSWKWISVMAIFLSSLQDLNYGIIACRLYRIFGKDRTYRVLTSNKQQRFINIFQEVLCPNF